MKKKKIIFVLPSLRMGGAEKNALNIMNRLDKRRYSVHLILFEKTGSLLNALDQEITIEELSAKNRVAKVINLYKKIGSIKPDIVFSAVINANILTGIVALFYKDCLYIGRETTVHSKLLEKNHFLMKKIIVLWYKLFISRLDKIIVQSQFMKDELISLFQLNVQKLIVLPNPVNKILDKQTSTKSDKTSDQIKLLSVGRLVPLKRTQLLLDVMSRLDNQYQLTIIGDGPEREELTSAIHKMNLADRVTLLGEVEDPTNYYNESDLLLVASEYDSYPNVIMEALSAGLRVIAFDVPGAIKEILTEPVRGRLIADNEMACYIEAIKEESQHSFSSERVKDSVSHQNWDQYIQKIERLFVR
ncbi:glycosyltransferase [Candidatus Enterococcus murrayae]|uniref:Glycosyltransferase n=1 Tax=Candidatus Enterococcus murrayae TaxID=2815321 RepID=A0ABS3HN65_9ENTE|nr:glycosyltransferase [Enterococcus sp. MJM16]MBO0454023.1 glycosyltransferase [Enterococcus sp. MJM16]